jgi:hypothetical protein
MDVIFRVASKHPEVPRDLIEKIIRHEGAVQFDEKRFEAGGYIRGLVFERLEDEEA